jgi:hypothetical protein
MSLVRREGINEHSDRKTERNRQPQLVSGENKHAEIIEKNKQKIKIIITRTEKRERGKESRRERRIAHYRSSSSK